MTQDLYKCGVCSKEFEAKQSLFQHCDAKGHSEPNTAPDSETEPDWEGECENCGESPVHPLTGMCGPCTFGEADTIGGNW